MVSITAYEEDVSRTILIKSGFNNKIQKPCNYSEIIILFLFKKSRLILKIFKFNNKIKFLKIIPLFIKNLFINNTLFGKIKTHIF